MNESNPIGEFLRGCGIGFILLLIALVSLTFGILFFLHGLNPHEMGVIVQIIEIPIGLALCALSLYLGILLIHKTMRAFSDQRSYFGMGMMAFILIPLLFFGACTMIIA